MKKSMILVIVVVLLGTLLVAAVPLPPPTRSIQGTLIWQRANICGVSDIVTTHTMETYYLTGNFSPTHGKLEGCNLKASGFPYTVNACNYFFVDQYSFACPDN